MASKKCCVPNCNVSRLDEGTTLHSFPNPVKDEERFRRWLYAVGGDILALDNERIYKSRRVCHKHFEKKYHTWTRTLSPDAIPTLYLPGLSSHPQTALSDITLKITSSQNIKETDLCQPSTSKGVFLPQESADPVVSTVTSTPALKSSTFTLKSASNKKAQPNVKNLEKMVEKLRKKKDNYAARLKKALKLSENETFQRCLKQFSTLAAMFTIMQFREISKHKMGRRFTKDEKIMALSLYKQGPKAYRFMSKLFILPSPVTLSRLLSKASLKPGINKKIFHHLKKKADTMNADEKLCILLFDEIAISPHFDYNIKNDVINGFVNHGGARQRNIADHALVFMIRGVLKNYKQPIAYTFCKGSTPQIYLKLLIKNIIEELQNSGLTVLATVCDQGTANVSAINSLIKERKDLFIKNQENCRQENVFQVNGQEIIPLYDPPHLIKGIRNNLISKNLKYIQDNTIKIAKWHHLMLLHEEDPGYKGIKLMKNLTEIHVNPKKISKMKVKYATQVFSKTVASNMGYLADKGILPRDCKDTADTLLFFDELFDSMNGSFFGLKNRSGKPLLGPVTPKSDHSHVWRKARKILLTMKFIAKNGKEGCVPSITNWVKTLNNLEFLKEKLFEEHNIKSFYMRHFNQDPLENFFGCIRSHGYRNISPTPSGFEAAFTSLLINNLSSRHSPGSNCEEDSCHTFKTMDCLLNNKDIKVVVENSIDFDDMNIEIENFENKKNNSKVIAQINYVAGYVIRQAKKQFFKNCKRCNNLFIDREKTNDYLKRREYNKDKPALTYCTDFGLKLFSEIQDLITTIMQNKSEKYNLKNFIKTILYTNVDFNVLDCERHRRELVEFIYEQSSNFFIKNWCRDVNKLFNGTLTKFNENDHMKVLIFI